MGIKEKKNKEFVTKNLIRKRSKSSLIREN